MKEIYVAEDGTDFTDKDACLAYEKQNIVNLPEKFPDLYIKNLNGFYPLLSKRSASDEEHIYNYQWFKLNNEDDWIRLTNALPQDSIIRYAFVAPRQYPEIVAIETYRSQFSPSEKMSYTGGYYYYHSDNRVIDLRRKLIESLF